MIVNIIKDFKEPKRDVQKRNPKKIEQVTEKDAIISEIRRKREKFERKVKEEYQKDEKDFEKNIDSHYAELVKFADQKQFDDTLKKCELFKKFKKTNYKDVAGYFKTAKIEVLTKKVKKIPASHYYENLRIYRELEKLDPDNQYYKNKIIHYIQKRNKDYDKNVKESYKASCDLELVNSVWSRTGNYATIEGQVKNISDQKMEAVQAVVTWYDRNGDMITSRSSFIKYNPILPGQTSPFKVMKTYNPATQKASIEFCYFGGETIKTYRRK